MLNGIASGFIQVAWHDSPLNRHILVEVLLPLHAVVWRKADGLECAEENQGYRISTWGLYLQRLLQIQGQPGQTMEVVSLVWNRGASFGG